MAKYSASAALLERAKEVIPGGVSSEFRKYNHPHALFYSHAEGTRIYDVDGNEYLDFTLSQGPMILGHSNPRILKAVTEYSARGQMFAGQHIKEIELAEKIRSIVPSAEMMRFCLDGSEAVQTAFRIARSKTGRHKFLRFEGHYHGWLDNVAWGLSAPSAEVLGDIAHPEVFPWSRGLPPQSRDEFIIIPWNDLGLLEKTLKEHHTEIAAVITEAVMCNSGCIEPEPGFLEGLRTLCTKYGCAFILDEVITGFRLSLGGAQSYFGIKPDIAVFAKAMASGYPISAVTGTKEWMEEIVASRVIHAGTMNSSQATVAAALETITILEEEQPYERMFRLGKKCMDGFLAVAAKTGLPFKVQGPGPMFQVGFTEKEKVTNYRDTFSYDRQLLLKFIAGMHNRGIRIIGRGLFYIGALHADADIDCAVETAAEVFKTI